MNGNPLIYMDLPPNFEIRAKAQLSLSYNFAIAKIKQHIEKRFSDYLIIHEENSKEIFNQYLEIGGRLEYNIFKFNLDFLSRYGWV